MVVEEDVQFIRQTDVPEGLTFTISLASGGISFLVIEYLSPVIDAWTYLKDNILPPLLRAKAFHPENNAYPSINSTYSVVIFLYLVKFSYYTSKCCSNICYGHRKIP